MKRYKEIKSYIGGMKNYGVCINPSLRECTFRYVACAEVSDFKEIPKSMEKQKFLLKPILFLYIKEN